MKKLISFIVVSAIVMSMGMVFAETKDDITAYYNVGVLTVDYTEDTADYAMLNIYSDGILVGSRASALSDTGYSFNVSEAEVESEMRLVYKSGEIYDVAVATPEPTPDATPEPQKTPRPEVYEKATDAMNAPAVVKSVSETMIDGETYYVLSMIYQGEEITANVRGWVEISSAPEKDIQLAGQNVNALQSGDVIHFACDMQGRIKSVRVIYRPDFADYIGNGADFCELYGNDGYSRFVFGVPVKTTKAAVTIADETGNITDIEVHKGAFVYNVSQTARDCLAELYGYGAKAIGTVYVNQNNFDDEGNVISWSDTDNIFYVLVRTVRGVATEIVVFEY